MSEWRIEVTDKYETMYKKYQKKEPRVLIAILANLGKYSDTLKTIGVPQNINAGFIHQEPHGVKALDQRRGKGESKDKKSKHKNEKLKETRLYIYPDITTKTLHLITIGNKNTQPADIKFCTKCVKEIKEREKNND